MRAVGCTVGNRRISAVRTLNQRHSRELEVKKVDAKAFGALYSVFFRSDIGLLGKYRNLLAKNQNMLYVNLRKWGIILPEWKQKIPNAQNIGDCRLEEGEVWRLFGAYSHSMVEGGFEEMS